MEKCWFVRFSMSPLKDTKELSRHSCLCGKAVLHVITCIPTFSSQKSITEKESFLFHRIFLCLPPFVSSVSLAQNTANIPQKKKHINFYTFLSFHKVLSHPTIYIFLILRKFWFHRLCLYFNSYRYSLVTMPRSRNALFDLLLNAVFSYRFQCYSVHQHAPR